MQPQLVEILSWRIICEVMRHAPDGYMVLETHPCSGQYDCLSLLDTRKRHLLDFNRAGSIHFWTVCRNNKLQQNNGYVEPINYLQQMQREGSTRELVYEICEVLGLSTKSTLPKGTPSVLMVRYIATFLTHATFGKYRWDCVNGMPDTSGDFGGVRETEFSLFPGVNEIRESLNRGKWSCFDGAYHFWFLRRDDEPALCLCTDGRLWDREGHELDLKSRYKQAGRNMWRLVVETAGDKLK